MMILLAFVLVAGYASALNELDGKITTYSQCDVGTDCKQADTNGTGHLLYQNLTDVIVDAERCYSFCFRNVRAERVGEERCNQTSGSDYPLANPCAFLLVTHSSAPSSSRSRSWMYTQLAMDNCASASRGRR